MEQTTKQISNDNRFMLKQWILSYICLCVYVEMAVKYTVALNVI